MEDLAPDVRRDLGDDGVAKGAQAVHPMGNPISHSTQRGFSCPPFPAVICERSEAVTIPADSNRFIASVPRLAITVEFAYLS